ncbi:MAG TPA: glycine cleavage system protein H [Burkholderiales bacterium]|nr:glycine cleavage system protein H [Burkholderiales bacterium]
MREAFRGRIPKALLYHPEHNVWLRREGDELVIGATSYGAYFAGEILAFTPKRVGAEIELGRSLGVVEVAKTLVAIHAPVSIRLTATNQDAVAQPSLINSDCYGTGWLVRGAPLRWNVESEVLVEREAYAALLRKAEPDAEIEP